MPIEQNGLAENFCKAEVFTCTAPKTPPGRGRAP